MEEEVGQDKIEAARRIREAQGCFEAEVSCAEGADLHQHYKSCQKNSGHRKFKPIQNVKKEDLPAGYNDDPSVSYLTNPPSCPIVITSHPHGCNKQLTFGEWTGRHTCGETPKHKGDDGEYDYMDTRYTYTADTCTGSSGAPVIRLMDPQRWWMGADYHPHSNGRGNNNKSGVVPEIVSPPTPSQEMLVNKILSDLIILTGIKNA